jgi:cytochrome d ubiquinol oxidase subunit II
MELTTVWFILIAVLWTGYFVLEGFDFGVGMLMPVLGRGEQGEVRKRVLLNTIGPVWDGNEVWLLTAGGATFAAFPHWYATMFSGLYLPLLIILVGARSTTRPGVNAGTSPSSPVQRSQPCSGESR